MQIELHKNENYGISAQKYASSIKKIYLESNFNSISDYGAGKKNLKKKLDELGLNDYEYFPYDPAFPEYGSPKKADMCCCIDVLEHIEEVFIDNILDDLYQITEKLGFFTVSTKAAKKVLPDGRNAHILLKPTSWWLPKLCERFNIDHLQKTGNGYLIIVLPKK